MSILIKNAENMGPVHIEGNRIASIGSVVEADTVIDAKNKAVLPGFVNTHTHAAMSLMRSYADDMELHDWLQNRIWPLEKNIKEEYVYWGTKLACLEMIKTGTTCYNDMYFMPGAAAKAAKETGMRAFLGAVLFDFNDSSMKDNLRKSVSEQVKDVESVKSERVKPIIAPHALYTVSAESLSYCAEYSRKHGLGVHFHLSETRKEVDDCVKEHGKRPVHYLDDIGFWGNSVVAAHCVYLDDSEINALAKRGVSASLNPTSNMKLASGTAPYPALTKARMNVCLGTDGCASNNCLDMIEAMKILSLKQKLANGPTAAPAQEMMKVATANGAKALRLDAGRVAEGSLADLILIDMKRPELIPNHDLTSNLVYSANGYCVDTTIIDGSIVMQNRVVEGEEEILEKAQEAADAWTTQ
ncbi:MAG: amidohydrolase [Candidatus Diapherotrites archaeon]|nr:amidohydrolase [Candidatus Diapherotrites archaeon]